MDYTQIRLIVYDCDGVLTDNRVYVSETGAEYAVFHRGDGFAIRMLKELGFKQIILSTEANPIVAYRAQKLQIPVVHNLKDKAKALEMYCLESGIALDTVLYVGNDMNDLEAMQLAGYRACPLDAEPEIKSICDWISSKNGGAGVIRELYRFIAHGWKGKCHETDPKRPCLCDCSGAFRIAGNKK